MKKLDAGTRNYFDTLRLVIRDLKQARREGRTISLDRSREIRHIEPDRYNGHVRYEETGRAKLVIRIGEVVK